MKTLMRIAFIIAIATSFFSACDQGNQMMKPILTPEPTVKETPPVQEIPSTDFTAPEKPETPPLPQGFTPLETDNIRHIKPGQLEWMTGISENAIFDSAAEAYNSQHVKDAFKLFERNFDEIINNGTCCEGDGLRIVFTDRDERKAFLMNFPGVYSNPESETVEQTENQQGTKWGDSPFRIYGGVIIYEDNVYFPLSIHPDPHFYWE